jgi:magnesium transporter
MRLERRTHPPGTSPGTIVVPARPEVRSRAVLTRFTATEIEEIEVDRPEVLAAEPAPGQLLWLDVEGHDEALITELGQRFAIPALVLEDVVNLGQRPKVEEYDGCVFVVADLVCRKPRSRHVTIEQISLVVKGNLLVSFKDRPSDVFEPIRLRLRSGKGRMRVGGLDYLAYALLDAVVDHCFPVLEELGARIEQIEEGMDLKPRPELLTELHRVRRDLVQIRRTAWPQREMVNRLLHAEDGLVQKETRVFLRDVADHESMIVDMVETYREMVVGLLELYLTTVSNRMNEVMKVLTVIATIFIPLSFVAALWGMNFDRAASPLNMPELGWYWGYPMALGVMALVAGAMLVFFWRRGWI